MDSSFFDSCTDCAAVGCCSTRNFFADGGGEEVEVTDCAQRFTDGEEDVTIVAAGATMGGVAGLGERVERPGVLLTAAPSFDCCCNRRLNEAIVNGVFVRT